MAEFPIRIKTEGGDQAVADLTKVGEAGGRALDRIKQGTQPASAGLKALNDVTGNLKGGLSELADHAGIVGSALSKMGPIGLTVAAIIGTVVAATGKLAGEAEGLLRFNNIFSTMLNSTEHASGQTVSSLNEIAATMKFTTMATAEDAKQAEVALLAFGNVTGEAFGRTIKAGQDLAVVMGTDLKSATVQIAKALEDPAQGLSRLSRAGIVFTGTQKEMIKTMVDSGDQAGALNAILGTIEKKIGGAGEADASTVTGAFHRLKESVNEMFEEMGKSSTVGAKFKGWLDSLAESIQKATKNAFDPTTKIRADLKEIGDLQVMIEKGAFGAPGVRTSGVVDAQKRISDLKTEIDVLMLKLAAEEKETATATASGKAHQALTSIAAQEAALEKQFTDQQVAGLDDLSDKRIKDAAATKQQTDARAKAVQAINDQIAALNDEYYSLGLSDRERAILAEEMKAENEARKVGIDLTTQQKNAIEAEAGAIYDRNQADRDTKAANDQAAAAIKKAKEDRIRSAEEQVKKIDQTFHDGFVHGLENGTNVWNSWTASLTNTFKSTVADGIYKMFMQPFVVRIAASIIGLTGTQSAGAAAMNAVTGSTGSTGNALSSIGSLSSLASVGKNISSSYATFSGGRSVYENATGPAFSSPMSGVMTVGAGMAGNAVGNWAGNELGAHGTGGNIGGTIGGVIGSIWGPVGTFVGSAIGSFIGSFIGNNQASNYTATGKANLATGTFGAGPGDHPNANTQAGANQLAQDAISLSQMLTAATGATESLVNIQTQVGQRDRIAFGFTDNGMGAFDPKNPTYKAVSSSDMKGAVAGLTQDLIDGLVGISDVVKTQMKAVAGKIDFSNATQAASDVQFAFGLLSGKLFDTAKPVSQMKTAIDQLNTAFVAAQAQATRLGLSTQAVSDAQATALQTLRDGFNAGIQDSILKITDPMAAELQAFATAAAARLQEAKDGGVALAGVEQLTALERDQIIKKYATSSTNALAGTAKSILDFVHQLTGTTASPLATQTSLANAKSYYQSTLTAAQGGDAAAQAGITQTARDYLDLQRQMSASSSAYFATFDSVTASLKMLANSLNVQGGVNGPGAYTAAQQSAMDAVNATVNYKAPPTPTQSDRVTAQSAANAATTADSSVKTVALLQSVGQEQARQSALLKTLTTQNQQLQQTVAAQQASLDRVASRVVAR